MQNIYFPLLTEEETKLPFYIKGVGMQNNQEHILRPEGHPDFHWIHTTKGRGKLILEGKVHIITENMGFFMSPNVPHEYYGLDEIWETHWIIFQGYAVEDLLCQIGLKDNRIFYLQDFHLMEDAFSKIMRSASINSSYNSYQTSVHLYQFLILCRMCLSNTNRQKNTKLMQLDPVITFLSENYDKNPSLLEMSEVIHVTPHYLCKLFQEVFKLRPFVYLTKIRLQKAKEFLMESDQLTIKCISERVGYNDISYFCAIFKEYEGITPTEFRKIHRQ